MEDRELACSLEYLAYLRPSLHYLANHPDPPAITHRWRGPPSFRERGLCGAPPTAFFHEQGPTSLHYPKPPSMWKEGDRVSGGGWRTRLFMRVPHTLAPILGTTLPISQTRRLSPTAFAVPPLSEKEGFCGASYTAFFSCDKSTSTHYPKPPSMWKEGDRASGGG